MIIKNRFQDFFKSGIIYGSFMGLFVGLSTQSFLLGLIMGIFAGALFGFLLFISTINQSKKFIAKRNEISSQRRIICEGPANFKNRGGWLFFTEEALEFYPSKFYPSQRYLILPLTKLTSSMTTSNKLEITAFDNKKFLFVVANNKEWKRQIDGYFRFLAENRKEGSV